MQRSFHMASPWGDVGNMWVHFSCAKWLPQFHGLPSQGLSGRCLPRRDQLTTGATSAQPEPFRSWRHHVFGCAGLSRPLSVCGGLRSNFASRHQLSCAASTMVKTTIQSRNRPIAAATRWCGQRLRCCVPQLQPRRAVEADVSAGLRTSGVS